MATYHEVITYEAPTGVVGAWVKEALFPLLWKILKEDTYCILAEEKIRRDEPYHRFTYIGAAQVEVMLDQTTDGIQVTFSGTNEYYGNDPQPKNEYDLLNGHIWAKSDIKVKITGIKLSLDKKFKDWSAQQNFQRINAEKRLLRYVEQTVVTRSATNAIQTPSNAKSLGNTNDNSQKSAAPVIALADARKACVAEIIFLLNEVAQEKQAKSKIAESNKFTALRPEQLTIEDFVSQLERLANLQRTGALTHTEFEQAKLRLLKATE